MVQLSNDEKERYCRNLVVPEIGEEGQEKLKSSRVLVVGTGGLGSPVCFYLAAAGIGTLGIMDGDIVDLSNLQRQILHSTPDIGNPKVQSAFGKLNSFNPEIKVVPYQMRFDKENGKDLIKDFDVVVDCTDNFQARYDLNEVCVSERKILVHAGVFRLSGQMFTIIPGEGPCYKCVFADPPPEGAIPSGREAGILGVVAGIFGLLEANEVIKLLLGIGEPLVGTLLTFDALSTNFRKIKIPRNSDCPICNNI